MSLGFTLGLALLAGLSIPMGALVSSNRRLQSFCYHYAIDSFVSYFGGSEAAVINHLLEYVQKPLSKALGAFDGKVRYGYDWDLNDVK